MSLIPPVIIPAAVKHTATIFFLHGLGDTGHGWASDLADIKPPHAKLICPTAPEAPVTINMGFEMPSWFDIRSLDKNDGNEDEQGVKNASQDIVKMIDDEIKAGIPADRILLGGFSQGAALSLYTGLTGPHSLAGLVILSGYLPVRKTISWDKINKPPVLQCHGDADTVVHYEVGVGTSKMLQELGKLPNFTFKTYENLQHSSSPREMRDVQNFIKEKLP
ncbi:acyl-protein thioesterase 1 [Folsomia candida]|uniref:palmitoyl-protein hydrolase n=1 Tax=Folsomia candida TaxID=158441 RepID=A0A226CX13_FOLCA|nr:acyl-protein thioesterase 1 [Folsomia candida]OXA37047.1 Acyl-protein thioesterase 1 [Folsomia candida]